MQTTHLSQPPSGAHASGPRHGTASNNIVPKSAHLPAVSQGVAQTLAKTAAHATAMAAVVPCRVEQEEAKPEPATEQPRAPKAPRRAATAKFTPADVLLNWDRFS